MPLSRHQLRAARALLDMDQTVLAKQAGISHVAITKFERGDTAKLQAKTEKAILDVLERKVEFTERDGVRRKADAVEIFEGDARFDDFHALVHRHMIEHGGEICVSAVDERLLKIHRRDKETHAKVMSDLVARGKATVRVIATQSNFKSTFASYRYQEAQSSLPTAFYLFGDCLALIVFDPEPYVIVTKKAPLAEAYRTIFNEAWERAKTPEEALR